MGETLVKTKAPVRISFGACGDSDYYMNFLGWGNVVNATIDLYSYCEIHKIDGNNIILRSLETGKTEEFDSIDKMTFGARELNLMKAVAKHFGSTGIEVITHTDAPLESGLGGSAAHAVAMIRAFNQLNNTQMTSEEVAKLAYHLERNVVGVEGGYQDQWASAYGGLNYLKFTKDKEKPVEVTPIKLTGHEVEELENSLLLFYVPRQKSGSALHAQQREKARESEAMLRMKRDNVLRTKDCLEKRKFNELGGILHFDWKIKKLTAPDISNSRIDEIYEAAMQAGALGGRFIGAGAGGSAMFFCPGKKENVLRALEKFGVKEIRYKFERHHEPKDYRITIRERIMEEAALVDSMLEDEDIVENLQNTANRIVECYRNDGKIIVFGNGGNAAIAQDMVSEMVNMLKIANRPMLNGIALTVNTSILTAISNDSSFENVFARQIESLADSRDVVIGMSTSGKAVNVLNGLKEAKKKGATVVYITGKDGGMISQLCEPTGIIDFSIKIPHKKTERIQEMHMMVGHILCELVENELFGQ